MIGFLAILSRNGSKRIVRHAFVLTEGQFPKTVILNLHRFGGHSLICHPSAIAFRVVVAGVVNFR